MIPRFAVRKRGRVALFSVCLAAASLAAEPITFTCPIGAAEFSLEVAPSPQPSDQNLDFKPVGEGVISPRPIPVCPGNGFVVYRDDFSAEEISALSTYVLSSEYRALKDIHTPYYLLAKLLDIQQRPVLEVAFTYLRASWEVDTENTRYEEYAKAAADGFETYLVDADQRVPDYFTSHLLLAELKRRVGDFAGAKTTLEAIKHHDQASKPYPSRIIILQYKLIANESQEPYSMP